MKEESQKEKNERIIKENPLPYVAKRVVQAWGDNRNKPTEYLLTEKELGEKTFYTEVIGMDERDGSYYNYPTRIDTILSGDHEYWFPKEWYKTCELLYVEKQDVLVQVQYFDEEAGYIKWGDQVVTKIKDKRVDTLPPDWDVIPEEWIKDKEEK